MVLPLSNPTKSFWIEAAKSPHRNHRSSGALPTETDVAIIGSGYAGVATAYWMHKYTEHSAKQPKVTILEAREICGCATGRNGGQLRPHIYSRYTAWSERFGAEGAMELINHEMAHLDAFKKLTAEAGIAEEVCLKYGETFDAAMSDEAWTRLKGNYEQMKRDHGADHPYVKACRIIEDPKEAEDATQMIGALAAVIHPSGQIWPYKFVHALVRILLEKGNLNLQSHTPVTEVSARDADGWITVKTERGSIRARTVVHATNRYASHLLPEFEKLILPERVTVAAIKGAPAGFIKRTGAQHFDAMVNNYHNQLPPPYNTIMIGGARAVCVHDPLTTFSSDENDKQIHGAPEFFKTWAASDLKDWPGAKVAELGLETNEGGCWTGVETNSADGFPFVGPMPHREGHWVAAGFSGHGMPRILLSAAHIAPLALSSIGFEYQTPAIAEQFPALPGPFHATPDRVQKLQSTDYEQMKRDYIKKCEASQKKPWCNTERVASALKSSHRL